jgi:hypothetical protein
MSARVKISDQIQIRKEFFGGLIFRKSDFAVFEINDKTLEYLEMIKISGCIEEICDFFKRKYDIDEKTFNSLTSLLLEHRIIYYA